VPRAGSIREVPNIIDESRYGLRKRSPARRAVACPSYGYAVIARMPFQEGLMRKESDDQLMPMLRLERRIPSEMPIPPEADIDPREEDQRADDDDTTVEE
jgi:hypothetical protein